ncbi:diaminobutyrate--2-oxoglutarate transaminase [Paenibacillus sp. L3-i20]|uniref:diaminobutyrate--2-oxoglutarate transaminase n=1 Tax=Paenibacillus sp. L3-i20 TaxID=2905833 RepID=UPI001EDEB9E2|nr:diaminobutyrate--2-oxoglutarate transaminase [Paenibacillus sp. L3-i20]GKU79088.1 diaminobutyrate--2-oxoglutarate transaminase [Paenibacillus sp. L3-i20]
MTKLINQTHASNDLLIFDNLESEVRSYCRSFPTKFIRSSGYQLWDVEGKVYIDFFAGAGALNYGHNHPEMKKKLIQYLTEDGISHSLDMATVAKEIFLTKFRDIILKPRELNYKIMFPGPTGTNSVESALKLARKVTGRQTIMSFTNAFHGMTLGSLSVTGNKFKRLGAGVPLNHSVSMPYDGYMGKDVNSLSFIESFLNDSGSGISLPAAVIVETLQGEGGINIASNEWLIGLAKLCKHYEILLIVDDVQMGCGRTGSFFSFERTGIIPDIVCLSKSIGGYGLPMAITLMKPELDLWEPGEHNGTFRGNNLAFVTAAQALDYWENSRFTEEIEAKGEMIRNALSEIVISVPELNGEVRGLGMMQGIAFENNIAQKISALAFKRGLIVETSGTDSEVIKIMPPLTIDHIGLAAGLRILSDCIYDIAVENNALVSKL